MANPSPSVYPVRRTRAHPADTRLSFLGEFLRAPIAVGSPLPSSRWLAEILFENVDWGAVRTFVEFGPGTGVFTRYALARLPRTARICAIDANPQFTGHLRDTITDDRLCPITGSALDVSEILEELGTGKAELILSGIPFSALSDVEARYLIRQCAQVLGKEGLFCAYQIRGRIPPFLRENFEAVGRRREWRHFPPYRLYQAKGGGRKLRR